jgi:hypothetical protein
LKEKVAALVEKPENTALRIRCGDHTTPSILKSLHKLRRQSAVARRYRSLAHSCHGVIIIINVIRGTLSLVSTSEEIFERKGSGSGLESREYGHRDPSR